MAFVFQRCACRPGESVQPTFEAVLLVERTRSLDSCATEFVPEVPDLVGEVACRRHHGIWSCDGYCGAALADVLPKVIELLVELLLAPVQRVDQILAGSDELRVSLRAGPASLGEALEAALAGCF
ncbi:hypothetical protein [Streptomyces sp. NBC_01445]|uniref:hypothetical protein n=1 Tax=Streptomyces sp. NBC_01445 TaxID=2903869 RepID=UPI002DD7EFDD|nr:hypothetical protein [Streptomyces sp. NBC_01445]WSE01953.1 hypothetical protein OG574_00010 [Streptomyces sp. NBC_01445]WSE10378.1 hypothetical protein OG574_48005 [Streptomyces sp. NBC_01445]WSE11056.1 hypothetical protein OG574_48020 [Streptomyces sp. NBC_01445]